MKKILALLLSLMLGFIGKPFLIKNRGYFL